MRESESVDRRSAEGRRPDGMDMTRERARTERRDLDKERGEPLAGAALRGSPRSLRAHARPLGDWTSRPRILVTNDDGVESRGLLALKQALEPMGDITVVAPDTNQSAVGHQKTLMRPLRVRERTLGDGSLAYSVDGSPTDAVSLAFLGYFGYGFDLVASGINYGANLGDDITYSGTVSAAMEAVINNCPAFAISQEYYEHPDFALAARAATTVARNILEHGLSPGELINVNVPAVAPDEFDGVEITRLGKRVYQDELVQRVDPRGIPYFWIGGPPPSGLAVRGDRFPRGHQPADRRDADPPRPYWSPPAEAPPDLELGAPRGGRRCATGIEPAGGRSGRSSRRLRRTACSETRTGADHHVACRRIGPDRSGPAALPPVGEDLTGGVLAVLAGHAPAGVGAGTRQVEAIEAEPVPGVPEKRAPQEELVEPVFAVHRVASGQAEVPLEVGRRQDLPRHDRGGESGCVLVERPDDEVREALATLVPRPVAQGERRVLDDDAHDLRARCRSVDERRVCERRDGRLHDRAI